MVEDCVDGEVVGGGGESQGVESSWAAIVSSMLASPPGEFC